MKKIFFLFFLAATTCATNAQQPKNIVHDPNAVVRNLSGFKEIEVSGGINLYLSQGASDAVAVSVDDAKNIDKIKTEVKNGVLKIFIENGSWNGWSWKNKKIKAYVTAKIIERIDASGACSVILTDKVSTTDLRMFLSGASSCKGDLAATTAKFDIAGASSFKGSLTAATSLKLYISGASVVSLTGAATTANIDVSGASNFKAYSFFIDDCKAEASGASSLSISVKKELEAEASGASSIRYTGSPNVKKSETSGASSIKKKDN